jgi:hypothetical protein
MDNLTTFQGLQLAIESGNFDKGAIESLLDNTDSSDKISRFDELSLSSMHSKFVLHVHQVDRSN